MRWKTISSINTAILDRLQSQEFAAHFATINPRIGEADKLKIGQKLR